MAQDYNIYIHSKGAGQSRYKSAFQTTAQKAAAGESTKLDQFKTAATKVMKFAKGGGNVLGPLTEKVGQAVPFVQLVIAALKIIDGVVSSTVGLPETYAGNYIHSMRYSQFKNGLSWFTNPIGNVKKAIMQQADYGKQNAEAERTQLLIGKSTLKNTKAGN